MRKNKYETTGYRPVILLLIAFIEGAAVMATELLSAKMLAPFFGTTIYAWAAVLAVTLLALATGYYFGGYMTTKHDTLKILRIILVLSGFLLILMPALSSWVMKGLIHTRLIPGLILSLMTFVFPAVFLFGMVSPVIIHTLVHHVDKTGSTAGKVYAISTIGGVINTLLLGFFIIPRFGIKGPAIVYGIIVLLTPLLIMKRKMKPVPVIILIIAAIVTAGAQIRPARTESPRFSVISSSEGILGQVKVVDINGLVLNGNIMQPRGLIVNNTWQTLYNRNDNENLLDYIYFIEPLLSRYKGRNANSLIVGLGGGMLAGEMQKTGMNVEAVEIDARLEKIARRYFALDPSIDVIIDDGRRFINRTGKKYSVIILDAFLGENSPWHLLTEECFNTIKTKLDDEGILIIQYFGHLQGDLGRSARSIYATLENSGFMVYLIGTRREEAPDRNLIFVASKKELSFDDLNYDENPYAYEPIEDIREFIIDNELIDLSDALILKDDLPSLELLLARTSLNWRNDLNLVLRDLLLEDELPIFY